MLTSCQCNYAYRANVARISGCRLAPLNSTLTWLSRMLLPSCESHDCDSAENHDCLLNTGLLFLQTLKDTQGKTVEPIGRQALMKSAQKQQPFKKWKLIICKKILPHCTWI